MQAALDTDIASENWKNTAIDAGNLSELYLTMGDVKQALDYARQSVDLADRSGDAFWRMGSRTTLADALHQAGSFEEADAAFREAEEIQKQNQPHFPLLYALQGFRYCDLLLSQGEYRVVQSRAGQTLEWCQQVAGASLLAVALGNLSLGRVYLMQAQKENLKVSETLKVSAMHLDCAVDGLRQAGTQHHIPRVLLSQAELRRVMGALEQARTDLKEALSIATRGGMRLYEADCHLEYGRLHLAMGEKAKARQSLVKAKQMIEEMGYHRRDKEVKELEKQLKPH